MSSIAQLPASRKPLLTEAVEIARGFTPRRPTQAHCRALLTAGQDLARAAARKLAGKVSGKVGEGTLDSRSVSV